MTLDELLFSPRSVVVYGASSDPDKLSGRPLDYLKRYGYTGRIHAINPRRSVVQGVPSHASLSEVPGPIDLVVIVVPAESVEAAVTECAEAGAGAAIIFASGFAETRLPERVALQDRLVAIAARSGLRLIGPNCLGSFSEADRAFATFSTAFDVEGERPDAPIALASQSGAVGTFTYSAMTSLGLGVRYFANTGNQADVSVVEILTTLAGHDDVDVLLGHLEGLVEAGALEALARRAADAGKPLVLLKAGRTAAGARAVAAHTASTPGDDPQFEEVLARHGAIRATSMEDMTDVALALTRGRRPRGRRVTIVTLSGGAGALACDAAVDEGLVVEPWREDARAIVGENLPYFGSTANPIDVTGAMINDVAILSRTLTVVGDSEETDAVLAVFGNADKVAEEVVAALRRFHESTDKPVFVVWTGGTGQARRDLLAAGVPAYSEPVRAVRAMARLVNFSLIPVSG
ncbi:CoA-binding protein [Cryptosporangium aurantiacum]|uniref:Acyl-CoA synthetase (NDP forming) n=1 Tax=Cryptosporangium aurantiacum TaxID=134849 RepID=A0A1M7R3R5_9ACTN|nr:CoA-binding protein [Cryptosporangium aurantiacum]SHN39560.1 Acyl-CoA synthetase (NDP forming) [Cryptosporangium aurantiacum]